MIATLTLNPALDIASTTPVVRPTHKLRCTPPLHDAGGGGINVARAVIEMGGEACAVFPAGGPAGDMIERLLDEASVPFATVAISGLTRESFAITEADTGRQYRFVLPGPDVDIAAQRSLIERIDGLSPKASYLVVSGSLPPGVGNDFFARLRTWCTANDCRAILDSSGAGLVEASALGAWLVKPSLSELEAIAGHALPDTETRITAARAMLRSHGAHAILLSLGAAGALLVTENAAQQIAAPQVRTVSGIGAGDTMVAALVLALSRGWELDAAARYGVAAGAAALLTPGTDLARRADVERLYTELKSPA
ncbi:1-phosphofructokinase family hexose kinase [Stakelama marina]|uniref:Phosphofructokinase n=1 Tax=Stakelama marina TaxID=2826939 RepID=A0A8T4IAB8_9SPHN|nr:1-phosphofructokinase family hexose kinase [Stakelama marina]MBR0551303.1 1-phosphofructokinase family hexose kinase [Stakelama marina]